MDRRAFLKTSAVLGGALRTGIAAPIVGGVPNAHLGTEPSRRALGAPRPLRILILGGTGFIGPYQVRYAVARGHHVSVFNRGKHQADLPESVEHLSGDRAVNDYASLAGKTWDAVIDNSATNPKWVQESTAALRGAVGRYMYVSSTGVYYPYTKRPIDESTKPLTSDPVKDDGSSAFGVAKARCEAAAESAFPGHALIVRPHYIVGPGDTTDRFPYWPQRLARGGEVLAPGKPSDPVQIIDVRDLTEWMIHALEADVAAGAYNIAIPGGSLRWDECLYGMHAVTASDVTWRWVEDYDFLGKERLEEIVPWVLLTGPLYGMTSISSAKAIAAGLTFRPLADTTRDTLVWWNSPEMAPRRAKPRFSMTPEREARLLAAARGARGEVREHN